MATTDTRKTLKPVEVISLAEKCLWGERCSQLKHHNSFAVRNSYYPYNMDEWRAKEAAICREFNIRIANLNDVRKWVWHTRAERKNITTQSVTKNSVDFEEEEEEDEYEYEEEEEEEDEEYYESEYSSEEDEESSVSSMSSTDDSDNEPEEKHEWHFYLFLDAVVKSLSDMLDVYVA